MVNRVPAAGLQVRQYFHRYTEDALDLCDVLGSYTPGAKVKLDDVSKILGLSGKPASLGRAKTLLDRVPRTVAVVANKPDREWETALAAHNVQFLSVSSFRSTTGDDAIEVDGSLSVVEQSLGFGIYSATDRSIRFPIATRFPLGLMQIDESRLVVPLDNYTGCRVYVDYQGSRRSRHS
jgi:hypothetical protein